MKKSMTEEEARQKLIEMDLIDNFLFDMVASREDSAEEFSRLLLKPILGREIGDVQVRVQKDYFGTFPGRRGIRLDLLVKEYDNGHIEGEVPTNIFDYEPEKKAREKELLPKRTRFYRAKIDQGQLSSGKTFQQLPNVYIIFVTSYDPFGMNRMVYTVKNRCVEAPELPYEDGATNIFLYCDGTEGNPKKELSELLHFIRRTKRENAVNQDLKRLQTLVDKVRGDTEVSKEYMLWSLRYEEFMEDAREEGRAIGIAEGREEGREAGRKEGREEGREEGHTQTVIIQVTKKLAKGKDIPQIADELEEEIQNIQKIVDAIKACGNTTDPQVVYDTMMKKPDITR